MSRSRFLIIFISLAFAVSAIVIAVSSHRALSGSSDFDVYYDAGRAIRTANPVYTVDRRAVNTSGSPFVYPPFFACLISFFPLLPIPIAASLWNLLNVFFFLQGVILIHKMLGKPDLSRLKLEPQVGWVGLVLLLSLIALVDNIAMAQVNPLIFFLVMLGLEQYRQRAAWRGGFWLGVATSIKLVPLIFFVFFLIERNRKVLVGGVVAALICFWLLPSFLVGQARNAEYHRAWFHETIQDHLTPLTLPFYATQLNPSHQNLQAVLFRLIIDWEHREATGGPHGKEFHFRTSLRLSEAWAGHVSGGLCAMLFLIFCWALFRAERHTQTLWMFGSMMSCIITAMLLLSPKVRTHFYVFLCFPWLVMLHRIVGMKLKGNLLSAEKRTLLSSSLLYFLLAIPYCKFLGMGAWSVLILFVHFTRDLFRTPNTMEPS